MKRAILLAGILFFILPSLFAGEDNSFIRGKVVTTDGSPAADVTIIVKGSSRGAISGEDGQFIIRNLSAGTYDLEISLTGYQTKIERVELSENQAGFVLITLEITQKQLQEVIVRSGIRSYRAGTVSSSMRLQTPILETPQISRLLQTKLLQINR